MPIAIKARGLEEAIKSLDVTAEAVDRTLGGSVKWGTKRLLREVKIMAGGKLVKVRSGLYRASIHDEYRSALHGLVGTDVIYGRSIEHGTKHLPGGVLRPKRAKFLAIPLPDAKTAAGVSMNPRDYADTFFITSNSGALLLMGARSPGGPTVPLFTLKSSVKKEGKRVFELAQRVAEPVIFKETNRRIGAMLKRVHSGK